MTHKELKINDKVYAIYSVGYKGDLCNNMLFMKMLIQIKPGRGNEIDSENLLIHIIQLIEGKQFHSVGFLNI